MENPNGIMQPEVEKTAISPERTAISPEKTAIASEKTAIASEKTAIVSQAVPAGNPIPPSGYKEGDTITVGGKNYTIEKKIGSGGEGDIFIVKKDGRRYALKKYHPKFHANVAVMPALQKLNDKHVLVEIVDFADDFELLEYVPGDSAASAGIKGNAKAILTKILYIKTLNLPTYS